MLGRMSEKVAVAVVFVAALFMTIMDTTIVNVALPTIGRDFSVAPTAVDGISTGYLVSLALFIPASGWLGDRFGGKRVLLAATVAFTVASALCGLAQGLGELVAFRILQGVGGGMMTPVGMAMLFRAFPPEERLRASAVLIVPTTLAPAVGPVLGGLLVSQLSWRWVFYVNVPLGAAAVAFGAVFLRNTTESRPGRFDVAGFVLSGAGLGLLMYGLSEGPTIGWGTPTVLAGIAAGAVLLAGMVLAELRIAEPMVAVRLLGDRLFRSGNAVTVLASIAFLGTLYVMSLYLQDGRGLSALASGLAARRAGPGSRPAPCAWCAGIFSAIAAWTGSRCTPAATGSSGRPTTPTTTPVRTDPAGGPDVPGAQWESSSFGAPQPAGPTPCRRTPPERMRA